MATSPFSIRNLLITFHIGIFLALLCSSLASAGKHTEKHAGSTKSDTSNKMAFTYHNGPLLHGRFSINLIWYGSFKQPQRDIINGFIASLSSQENGPKPSVSTWWATVAKLYPQVDDKKSSKSSPLSLSVGNRVIDESYSLGKSLTMKQVEALASKGGDRNAINVVFTADDVAVEGFCTSRCGTHGSMNKSMYVWVGNSEKQCPGKCAWPYHTPIQGPRTPALVAPNKDVGLDGVVINLATMLACTVTNPFGDGYYMGPKEAPLEAATACPSVYGKGAYPGNPGELLVDAKTKASYNAYGVDGRKYLLPALFDPSTSTCFTLVSSIHKIK